MKQIILALMLAVAGIGVAVAANPIREGNMISGVSSFLVGIRI